MAAAVALTLLLVGCSSTPSADAPQATRTSSVSAPHLAVTVLQQRVDATTRMVGVDTTNHERTPVHVDAVRLTGGGLDAPVTEVDADLQPRLTVALRGSYGRPDCTDRSGPVVAHLQIGGRWIAYPVDRAGQAQVRRLLDTDCASLTLAKTAAVRLAGPYRQVDVNGAPSLRGQLVVVRRSSGRAVDVRSLEGSVLVDLRPANKLNDLRADVSRAVTPVLLGSTGRCDPHGLGQATQTFLLSAYVRLQGYPTQRVVLTPPRPVQGRILHVVDQACGTS
jgi:hypothetical protein